MAEDVVHELCQVGTQERILGRVTHVSIGTAMSVQERSIQIQHEEFFGWRLETVRRQRAGQDVVSGWFGQRLGILPGRRRWYWTNRVIRTVVC